MTETRKVNGDTFTISVVNGRILVNKNDKQKMTLTPEQAKEIGVALAVEGAIRKDWLT